MAISASRLDIFPFGVFALFYSKFTFKIDIFPLKRSGFGVGGAMLGVEKYIW